MNATYLLRFDDASPTMNWIVWDRIERLLHEHDVRPIVAVVPDNRDENLRIFPPDEHFWDRVRAWQGRGWAIGLHGYQHLLTIENRGLFGWNDRSEFAGLPAEVQERKIGSALEIFRREGVTADVWVAPNHSFDHLTLKILRAHGLSVVSDGLGLYPFRDRDGTTWVPRQITRLMPRPFGVWTICHHPNRWDANDLASLRSDLIEYGDRVTDLGALLERYGSRMMGWGDRLFAAQRRARKHVHRNRDRSVRAAR
jgi:predicted deacetylase